MIKFTDNSADIVSLWSKVFGDSEEEIRFFIDNAKNSRCLAYYSDDKILSMLFLVECFVEGREGRYIYAACTDKSFEGRGLMTKLLEFSKGLGYDYICLIPANNSLIDFYGKRGFDKSSDLSNLNFNQTDEIKEYLFEGYELDKPMVMICEV